VVKQEIARGAQALGRRAGPQRGHTRDGTPRASARAARSPGPPSRLTARDSRLIDAVTVRMSVALAGAFLRGPAGEVWTRERMTPRYRQRVRQRPLTSKFLYK
jgi:hypothetical protein